MAASPINMPAETAKKFRFTRPIYGGPVFDFPQFNLRRVDLSQLTLQQAERLLRAGWKGIELLPAELPATPRTPADMPKEK